MKQHDKLCDEAGREASSVFLRRKSLLDPFVQAPTHEQAL